jgi:CRISPR/Cas system Type II protein with McrA/HNH and RuvC-like nuclease domain
LKQEGKVFCVWTGNPITSYDVDHMIPFSVWKNNDLWNLLPSQSKTNNQKRDKIPSTDLIEKRKDLILHYWNLINENQSQRFQKEIRVALLGNSSSTGWQEIAIKQLQSSCNYLITNRGYEEWKI